MRVGDGVLFAERANDFMCVAQLSSMERSSRETEC